MKLSPQGICENKDKTIADSLQDTHLILFQNEHNYKCYNDAYGLFSRQCVQVCVHL